MKQPLTWGIMSVVLVMVVVLGLSLSNPKQVTQHRMNTMPIFTLSSLLDDAPVTQSDVKGDWLLVNFWATWCSPCIQEHPVLVEIAAQYPIKIMGINYKDNTDVAREWLAQKGNPYTYTLKDEKGMSIFDWGAVAVPETFLVNPNGEIVHRFTGSLTHEIFEQEFLGKIS